MLLKDIEKNFPFVSVVQYGGNEYVGIVINQDQFVTSMYVYTKIRTEEEKHHFLELGSAWWWESNRLIPITIFMREEVAPFKYAIITMNSKDVKVTIGPTINLNNMAIKRIKRKSVQLVKKPKG
jgi:hypothetical protein|tara:strand:- start:234 stop:605 length:372 start_codon:yes stop_codon:yes gene_type:complete